MFILITASNGDEYVVKRSDIRRIYTKSSEESYVCFTGTKNPPITVKGSPADFFNVYLTTKL